jgi:signal transduction histidine kinase
VVLAVADEGPGIPPDRLDQIFESGFRVLGEEDERRSPGAGLGLFIAKGIVEAHGGRIWAESTMEVGTTFFVALPLRQNQVEAPAATSVSSLA